MGARAKAAIVLALVAAVAAGCGSSPKPSPQPRSAVSALMPMRLCFRRHGYSVAPDGVSALRTAPADFEFVAVWNLVNPNRVSLAVTISKSVAGARRAALWTRHENAAVGKGVVDAPVVQFGKVDVLWTAKPGPRDVEGIYACVRAGS